MLTKNVVLTALLCIATEALPTRAAEPARAFLDGLRARGLNDVALDYLEGMETSRLTPAEFRPIIPYERALTLVESSRSQRDLDVRFQQLDDAQKLLREFVEKQASHPRAHAARSQLGNLIVERARIKVEQSKSGNAAALLKEARKEYETAFKEFSELEASVSEELEKIPKVLDTRDRKQADLAQRRQQLRADNLQTELLAAAIREETADTVQDGSKEQTAYLTEAAALYDAIYKKYRRRLAGFYARMYQGRCNHRLGKTKDALGYYGELLDQPNEPEDMFVLKTKTLRLAMESWLAPNEKKYMEAIKQASEWLAIVPRHNEREPDMLAIRLNLARAYKMQADDLETREPRDTRTIAVSIETGKKHAQFVANEPGELSDEAQQLVVKLGGRQRASEGPPETFTAAQEAGKKALDAIGPASQKVVAIQTRLQTAKPAQREKIEQELAEAQAKMSLAQTTAMDSYRLAMRLADQDTPPSELNLVRYFVCYLYYLSQQFHEAALMGDFVARHFPESAGAKECAKIGLACYMAIFETAPEDDNEFEVRRVASAANYMADTWPDTPEAVEALSKVVPIMVNARQYDQAKAMTLRIPESAPTRGQSELVTGQAIWGRRVQLQQEIQARERGDADAAEVDAAAETKELEELAGSAKELLVAGYDRLPEQPEVTVYNATALLSLAQAYVESSEHTKAVEVLEHALLGPITLVDAKHEAASNPVFVEETYRTALQAYIGSMNSGGAAMMEKAKGVMASLQAAVGSDAAGKQRMLGIYVNLAKSVESQMKSATPEAKQEMSQVFEAFLQELSAGSSDVGVLNWVAETFASLGAGFDDNPDVLNPDAKKYYERSIGAFQNLLSVTTLDPKLATQMKARMASVKASNHDFQNALSDFTEILTKTPSAVNVQVQAARLLQRWAATTPANYEQAILGVPPGGKGVVWGWGKIANATISHKQFRETFYEARYEMAKCQLGLAGSKQGDERKKLIASAEKNLTRTKQLYPTLGGEEWTQKYNELLGQIRSTR